MRSKIVLGTILGLAWACSSSQPGSPSTTHTSTRVTTTQVHDEPLTPQLAMASTSCAIKGNISRDGTKIYHMPNGQYWSRTRIEQHKGERMFCSPSEAEQAGWRPSRR